MKEKRAALRVQKRERCRKETGFLVIRLTGRVRIPPARLSVATTAYRLLEGVALVEGRAIRVDLNL